MHTILVVEDDIYLLNGLKDILSKEGFSVIPCCDSDVARVELLKNNISLVLLDIMLPGDDGITLCKEIRKSYDMPIVFLTARDNEIDVVRSLDAGGDDYITKPFRIREVLSRIRAALRRYDMGIPQTTITKGDITIDPIRRVAKQNAEELLLTPIEFQLLLMLMQNCKQTLTRNQLLQAIWDSGGSYIEDNTLSVHICRLRDKLTNNSLVKILTIRGVGYKLDFEGGRN